MAEREPLSAKFTITNLDNNAEFTCRFADGPAVVVEGYAGWQVISRPKDVGIVEWQGRNPMSIEIPFLIDYFIDDPDINLPGAQCEAKIKILERMCGIGSHAQPPILRVDGGGLIPHDYTINKKLNWVIENLTWDKAVEYRDLYSGRRRRAGGTIVIREFRTAKEILRTIKSSDRARRPKWHIVKKGENLKKIAGIYYRDPNKWKLISDANNIRDPRHLKINSRLKIPRG
jgi:hypothetical protein